MTRNAGVADNRADHVAARVNLFCFHQIVHRGLHLQFGNAAQWCDVLLKIGDVRLVKVLNPKKRCDIAGQFERWPCL